MLDWPGGLTVFDLRAEAMEPFVEAGATAAAAVTDVADADLISVVVLNDEQVRDVVGQLADRAKPGTVIAIHSTISDTTAAELAEQYTEIHVIDAPVSGGAGRRRRARWRPWWVPNARCTSGSSRLQAVGLDGHPCRTPGRAPE